MTKRHYVIYIPGLGDKFDMFRRASLRLWAIWGVKTELVPMHWDSEKEFAPKLTRITTAIRSAKKRGYAVSVIGESAGATMAINIGAKHELHQIMTLCGVNNPKMHILPQTYKRAPAFKKAFGMMGQSFATLDLLRVQTVSAYVDKVISPRDSSIPGARNHRLFSFGHLFTVSLCLTFLSGYIASLIKR
jgi:hypothetical protein